MSLKYPLIHFNLPFPLIFFSSWHIDTSPSDWSAGLGGKEDSWQISGQYKSQRALMKYLRTPLIDPRLLQSSGRHQRNLAITSGVTASILVTPVLAGLAVSIGVPILLAYVYGVVPISLCRYPGRRSHDSCVSFFNSIPFIIRDVVMHCRV